MYRYVGIFVVFFVLYISFPSLLKLYDGEQSAQQSFKSIKQELAKTIEK